MIGLSLYLVGCLIAFGAVSFAKHNGAKLNILQIIFTTLCSWIVFGALISCISLDLEKIREKLEDKKI